MHPGHIWLMTESQTPQPIVFDADEAEEYDRSFERLHAVKDALHLMTRIALADLPDKARILVVGAGTGQEILALGAQRPGWRFTAVDISAPMLAVAERKLQAAGMADRCVVHIGELSTLADDAPFDAATSFLVSHFFVDADARTAFFRGIRSRLAVGGHLINADLSAGDRAEEDDIVRALWRQALAYAGMTPERIEGILAAYGRDVALSTSAEVARILAAAGFGTAACFYQLGFIRAWQARAV